MRVNTNAHYIFDQLTDLLSHLTDEQYRSKPPIFSGASVGKHYRHIIEFFQCIVVADHTETICYDNRLRDERIENSRQLAIDLLSGLRDDLREIDNEKHLTLIGDLGVESSSASTFMQTSLLREFHYAVEHGIHHMAIIKMGVREAFPSVQISSEFGVAPSTLRYEASTK